MQPTLRAPHRLAWRKASTWASLALAGLAFLVALPCAAQTAAPTAAPNAPPSAAPTVAEPPAPPQALCPQITDQAMAADMKAATAQAQRADAADLARFFDAAIGLWQQAVQQCEGRPRERAQRNLADDQKQRAALGELLGAGEQCGASQKDANTLQELARQATGERRWQDATMLYRKAENMWELASERCTGAQAQLAVQRRDQVAIDGHNAEFCAPRFDRAREYTQRYRNAVAALSPADKQGQLQIAETLWRDAIQQCKGPPLDLARSNAQNMARDRGTPWAASWPADASPEMPRATASRADGPAAVPGSASSPSTRPAATPAGGAAVVAKPGLTGSVAAATVLPGAASAAPKPIDITLQGGTKLVGLFALAADGLSYTGEGDVNWPNGDRYRGSLLAGKRHGRGDFTWPDGQRYQGDWVDDRASGRGQLRFANGNLFDGELRDGQPQGQGKMVYASGDAYTGQFDQGLPHGQGIYLWLSGQRYEGLWQRGQAEGGGARMAFANGNQYEGEVRNGAPHGQGKMVFASGDVYAGQFAAGQADGQGSYQWKQGDRYVGGFKVGLKDGQGLLTWPNGDRWEGLFRADQQTAQGQLTRAAPPPGSAPVAAAPAGPPVGTVTKTVSDSGITTTTTVVPGARPRPAQAAPSPAPAASR